MDTREQIISAAKEEFFAQGFDATRMRAIADRAGINKGLLHYYFKSKEALLLEVFQRTFQRFFLAIEEAAREEISLFDMIETVVGLYLDHMLNHPQLPGFIINEMNRDPEQHFKRMQKAAITPPFTPLMEAVAKAKSSGAVRADADATQFLINLISLCLFPFIAKNMLIYFHGMSEKQYIAFIKQRKNEITYTLIQSLKAIKTS